MYLKVFQFIYSTELINVNNTNNLIDEFLQIVKHYDPQDLSVEYYLFKLTKEILNYIIINLTNNNIVTADNYLDKYINICKEFCPITCQEYVTFFINKSNAFKCFLSSNYTLTIKYLNPLITNCPRSNGQYASGLADALIIISECYSQLDKLQDALLSARLAVTIAQERMEYYLKSQASKDNNKDQPNQLSNLDEASPWISNEIMPSLPPQVALTIAYHNLAVQLERNGLAKLAIEWHERSYHAGQKSLHNTVIINELDNYMRISKLQLLDKQIDNQIDKEIDIPIVKQIDNSNVKDNDTNNAKDNVNDKEINKFVGLSKSESIKWLLNQTEQMAPATTDLSTSPSQIPISRTSSGNNLKKRPKSAVSKLGESYNKSASNSVISNTTNNDVDKSIITIQTLIRKKLAKKELFNLQAKKLFLQHKNQNLIDLSNENDSPRKYLTNDVKSLDSIQLDTTNNLKNEKLKIEIEKNNFLNEKLKFFQDIEVKKLEIYSMINKKFQSKDSQSDKLSDKVNKKSNEHKIDITTKGHIDSTMDIDKLSENLYIGQLVNVYAKNESNIPTIEFKGYIINIRPNNYYDIQHISTGVIKRFISIYYIKIDENAELDDETNIPYESNKSYKNYPYVTVINNKTGQLEKINEPYKKGTIVKCYCLKDILKSCSPMMFGKVLSYQYVNNSYYYDILYDHGIIESNVSSKLIKVSNNQTNNQSNSQSASKLNIQTTSRLNANLTNHILSNSQSNNNLTNKLKSKNLTSKDIILNNEKDLNISMTNLFYQSKNRKNQFFQRMIELFNTSVIKIQSLIRGVLVRKYISIYKIIHIKQMDLKNKEMLLLKKEKELKQTYSVLVQLALEEAQLLLSTSKAENFVSNKIDDDIENQLDKSTDIKSVDTLIDKKIVEQIISKVDDKINHVKDVDNQLDTELDNQINSYISSKVNDKIDNLIVSEIDKLRNGYKPSVRRESKKSNVDIDIKPVISIHNHVNNERIDGNIDKDESKINNNPLGNDLNDTIIADVSNRNEVIPLNEIVTEIISDNNLNAIVEDSQTIQNDNVNHITDNTPNDDIIINDVASSIDEDISSKNISYKSIFSNIDSAKSYINNNLTNYLSNYMNELPNISIIQFYISNDQSFTSTLTINSDVYLPTPSSNQVDIQSINFPGRYIDRYTVNLSKYLEDNISISISIELHNNSYSNLNSFSSTISKNQFSSSNEWTSIKLYKETSNKSDHSEISILVKSELLPLIDIINILLDLIDKHVSWSIQRLLIQLTTLSYISKEITINSINKSNLREYLIEILQSGNDIYTNYQNELETIVNALKYYQISATVITNQLLSISNNIYNYLADKLIKLSSNQNINDLINSHTIYKKFLHLEIIQLLTNLCHVLNVHIDSNNMSVFDRLLNNIVKYLVNDSLVDLLNHPWEEYIDEKNIWIQRLDMNQYMKLNDLIDSTMFNKSSENIVNENSINSLIDLLL